MLVGISAIFSAVDEVEGQPVNAVFHKDDIPDYQSCAMHDCPLCKEGRRIDAPVNSFGYPSCDKKKKSGFTPLFLICASRPPSYAAAHTSRFKYLRRAGYHLQQAYKRASAPRWGHPSTQAATSALPPRPQSSYQKASSTPRSCFSGCAPHYICSDRCLRSAPVS